jgi:hypothetical protein
MKEFQHEAACLVVGGGDQDDQCMCSKGHIAAENERLGIKPSVKEQMKRVTMEVPQFLADHLKLWAGTGEIGPGNELQSIQAWLRNSCGKTMEEVIDTMRKRMTLLMNAASAIHEGGPEAEDSYGIYSEVSREHMRDKQEILRLHRELGASRLYAKQGWQRAEAKSKECNEIRMRLANTPSEEEIKSGQLKMMWYDPATGEDNPKPYYADEYRAYHGKVAWLYNPWTGKARHPGDIGTDVLGLLIVP